MRQAALTAMLQVVVLCGCSGPLVNVAPVPPSDYSEAGKVTGDACGLLLLGMLPVNVNDRAERAYDSALKRAHATSLTDTALTETWYFTPVGPAICTSVDGVALVRSTTVDVPRPAVPRAELRENRRSDVDGHTRD